MIEYSAESLSPQMMQSFCDDQAIFQASIGSSVFDRANPPEKVELPEPSPVEISAPEIERQFQIQIKVLEEHVELAMKSVAALEAQVIESQKQAMAARETAAALTEQIAESKRRAVEARIDAAEAHRQSRLSNRIAVVAIIVSFLVPALQFVLSIAFNQVG